MATARAAPARGEDDVPGLCYRRKVHVHDAVTDRVDNLLAVGVQKIAAGVTHRACRQQPGQIPGRQKPARKRAACRAKITARDDGKVQ